MPDELDRAARDFVRYCLEPPEQHFPGGWLYLSLMSQANSDGSHVRFDDVREVLPLVSNWCKLNTVTLEIHYFDGVYLCRFIDSRSLCRRIETTGSANLCHELLAGAATLARRLASDQPNTFIGSSDLAETRTAGS